MVATIQLQEQQATIEKTFSVVWGEFQSVIVGQQRILEAPHVAQRIATIVETRHRARCLRNREIEFIECGLQITAPAQQQTQIVVERRCSGTHGKARAVGRDGKDAIAGPLMRFREQALGLVTVGTSGKPGVRGGCRRLRRACAQPAPGQFKPQVRGFWTEFAELGQHFGSLMGFSARAQQGDELAQGMAVVSGKLETLTQYRLSLIRDLCRGHD